MRYTTIITKDTFEISDFNRAKLRQEVKDNGGKIRGFIETLKPESRYQRKYLMGGLIPLLVYLDGNDYHDSGLKDFYFDELKRELTPETVIMHGKAKIKGRSSKGSQALNDLTEKVQDYLVEQYGLDYDNKALDPNEYKKFRDEIYSIHLEFSDYISYCVAMKFINKPN